MYILDLGIYQSVAASCLFELVMEGAWLAATVDDRFCLAHADYKAWCKEQNVAPCPRFHHKKLVPSQTHFPMFTQQQAKASMTRYLMKWLHSVLARPGISDGPHGNMRCLMFDKFVGFEHVCDSHGRWLPPAARDEIASCVEAALLCMNALHAEALQAGVFRWVMFPKNHMLTHSAYDMAATGVNPRRTTCYADEDMVGRSKKIMSKCHGATAGRMCLYRYAILVGTRWWTQLATLRRFRG